MRVPFTDLNAQYKDICKPALRRFKALMERGDFILGQDVQSFEKAFADYNGAKRALGVNSGTDALFFGLLSLGVGPGDEVIVPDYTYIASAFAVTYTGAKPVFVDIDEKTFNINPEKIESAITKNTKAIMPVHLYGQAADMEAIKKIAEQYKLDIIEDAAQAHGCEFKGKKAGVLGDVAAFSFYPTKNLSAFGDAGMITTNSLEIYEKLKKLRDYGRKTRYEHTSLGYNSRLDSMQAVFLIEKLKKLNKWNNKRIQAAAYYRKLLQSIDGIVLPQESNCGNHVYHIFAIRVKKRDDLMEYLKKNKIDSMVHYPVPLHLQEVYSSLGYKKGDFPIAEKVANEVLCLPIYPHITKEQINFVANNIKEWIFHA